MKFSIITVCKNAEKAIERTILSVLSQTYENVEYIIVDGASTDGTVEIIKRYAAKYPVVKWISEPDTGIYQAMNKGIELSSGDVLNFLNAGDLYVHYDVLKFISNVFYENYVDVLLGGCFYVNPETGQHYVKVQLRDPDRYFFYKDAVSHQSVFYRRKVFEDNLRYREDYQIVSDTILNMEVFTNKLFKKKIVDTVFVLFLLDGVGSFYSSNEFHIEERKRFSIEFFSEKEREKYLIKINEENKSTHLKNRLCVNVEKLLKFLESNLGFENLRKSKVFRKIKKMFFLKDDKHYISAEETVNAAEKEGLSVCDYVEKMWDNVGATDKVIENMNQICGFTKYEKICEIGPGTGRYLEKIVKLTNPKEYHIYEIDKGWADWLEKEYSPPVIKMKADGRSLKNTENNSCDLVHAHGVFVYLPFLTSYEYFREMIRVCKNGGYIVFDFYDDNDFTMEVIEKWLASDSRFSVLLNGNKIKEFFKTKGLSFQGEFENKHGQSFSRYFVFKKEVD